MKKWYQSKTLLAAGLTELSGLMIIFRDVLLAEVSWESFILALVGAIFIFLRFVTFESLN
jgi:hypothetical protein